MSTLATMTLMEAIDGSTLDVDDVRNPYPIDAAVRQRFESDGFVRLPSVLSKSTIEYFEPEVTAKVVELNTMHRPMAEHSTYNKAFLQVSNLWRHSEQVKQLTFSRRLARIAADLMGVERVRLYHDQALYKEIGGGITSWHADQYCWPLSSDRSCTVWIPLQDTPDDMGPLEFAAGSHRFGFGRDLPISDKIGRGAAGCPGRTGLRGKPRTLRGRRCQLPSRLDLSPLRSAPVRTGAKRPVG